MEAGIVYSLLPTSVLAATRKVAEEGPMVKELARELGLREMAKQKLHHGKTKYLTQRSRNQNSIIERIVLR